MTAIMDFPAAWEFVRSTKPEDHAPKCSWRTENGALLCDCSVIWIEYGRRSAALSSPETTPAGVLDEAADDVRYDGGNGTSEYWRGFNDGIDRLIDRLRAAALGRSGSGGGRG